MQLVLRGGALALMTPAHLGGAGPVHLESEPTWTDQESNAAQGEDPPAGSDSWMEDRSSDEEKKKLASSSWLQPGKKTKEDRY